MTAASHFKQSDVTRVFKAARQAGYTRVRVGIDVQGNIVADASDEPVPIHNPRANPLDRLLEGR